MLDIQNSVAVITGANGGIGKALAKYWLVNGGKVVLADLDQHLLQKTESELKSFGKDIVSIVCDVTIENDHSKLAKFAIEQYGAINLVAPFAGITDDGLMVSTDRKTGKVSNKMSLEQFQRVLDINLTGVFLTIRDCVEEMINNNCKGLVCLISSTGSHGTAGQINYSASKAAISSIPKVMTAEFFRRNLSSQIRCMAVAPGYVGTPMVKKMNERIIGKIVEQVPIGRLIEPEEVVSIVGELYKNEAMAGDTVFIHGGLRLGSKG